jgi:hypothetical protein
MIGEECKQGRNHLTKVLILIVADYTAKKLKKIVLLEKASDYGQIISIFNEVSFLLSELPCPDRGG